MNFHLNDPGKGKYNKLGNIAICTSNEKQVSAHELKALYDDVHWWPERDIGLIEIMLRNGLYVAAWSGYEIVGFCRTISDGVFRAYIEDMCVRTDYQRQGIGSKLLNKMMKELQTVHIVSLFCSSDLVDHYKWNHFKETNQIVMHWKQKYGIKNV